MCHCSLSSAAGLGDTSENALLTEQWHTAAPIAIIPAHTRRPNRDAGRGAADEMSGYTASAGKPTPHLDGGRSARTRRGDFARMPTAHAKGVRDTRRPRSAPRLTRPWVRSAVSRASAPVLIEARAEPTVAYAGQEAVPAHLLDGGEVVILAIKPSPWFVLIRSLRWLACLAVLALVIQRFPQATMANQALIVAAIVVIALGALQWVSRLYVLTNRRVMRFRGVLKVEIFHTPLENLTGATLSVAPYERLLRIGTIYFDGPDLPSPSTRWVHLARADEVHRTITETLRRAHNSGAMRNL